MEGFKSFKRREALECGDLHSRSYVRHLCAKLPRERFLINQSWSNKHRTDQVTNVFKNLENEKMQPTTMPTTCFFSNTREYLRMNEFTIYILNPSTSIPTGRSCYTSIVLRGLYSHDLLDPTDETYQRKNPLEHTRLATWLFCLRIHQLHSP